MKSPIDNRFERVSATYFIDEAMGAVRVGSRTMSMLVPVLGEEEREEAFIIDQAKVLIAADQDVGEQHVCVVGVTRL